MFIRHFRGIILVLLAILILSVPVLQFAQVSLPIKAQSNFQSELNDFKEGASTGKKVELPKPDLQTQLDQVEAGSTDNTLLIKVREGENVDSVKNLLKEKIGAVTGDKNISDEAVGGQVSLQLESKNDLKESLKLASKDSKIEFAQPNFKYKKQYVPSGNPEWDGVVAGRSSWYLKNQASGNNAEQAWDAMATKFGVTCAPGVAGKQCGGQTSVKIAVIDSGVNTDLTEFAGASFDIAGRMRFYNQATASGNCASEDGTQYLPANGLVSGQTYCQSIGQAAQTATKPFDEDGHGTAVSSIIIGQNNTTGTLGIAHGTTILPIALHDDTFNTFFISEAIKYAQTKGAKVINLSLGTAYYDSFLESTINSVVAQGVVVVASSGNCAVFTVGSCDWDGNGVQTPGLAEEANNAPIYPAAFANVISVGASNYSATTGGITRSCYSNYGATLDIVAPVGDARTSCNPSGTGPSGVTVPCGAIVNTYLSAGHPCYSAVAGTYYSALGTSFAAPQVAAAVGLLFSSNSNLNPETVKKLLNDNSKDVGITGRDDIFGYGLLDLNQEVIKSSLQCQSIPNQSYCVEIYNNKTLSGNSSFTLGATDIKTNWGNKSPLGLSFINNDNFSVRWIGNFTFANTDYEFNTEADDGARVFLDGVNILDDWSDHAANKKTSVVRVPAGTHELKVEYYENTGDSLFNFSFNQKGAIKIYNNTSYSGKECILLENTNYADARTIPNCPDFNDITESIYIPYGECLEAFQNTNFDGWKMQYCNVQNNKQPLYLPLIDKNVDKQNQNKDQFSSFKTYSVDINDTNKAFFFVDADFSGYSSYLGTSETISDARHNIGGDNRNKLSVGNDNISSFSIPSGSCITLYQHILAQDNGGISRKYCNDTSTMQLNSFYGGQWENDQLSAVKTELTTVISSQTTDKQINFWSNNDKSGITGSTNTQQNIIDLSNSVISNIGNSSISSFELSPRSCIQLYTGTNFTSLMFKYCNFSSTRLFIPFYYGWNENDSIKSLKVNYL
jgi:Subtilase family/PA14 domain